MGELITYQQSMTVCWSHDHHHMITSLMKFAVGKYNVTTSYHGFTVSIV